jgi:hypothetical protein
MNLQQHFKEHEGKLRFEALLKALLLGIVVGTVVGFVTATLTWFLAFDAGLWLSIGLAVIIGALSTWIFYEKTFKPNVLDNARRLDRLGLDERLVTMVEYQNDDSYMAAVQRRDAQMQLGKIKSHDVRIKVPLKLIIGASISFVLCCAMMTVSALSWLGILPNGPEFIESLKPEEPDVYISVIYDVEEGGSIKGESDQLVLKGTDATPVLAVAEDGYVFVGWSDGQTDPYRHDTKVLEELEIFATFELSGEDEGGDEGEGEGDGDQEAPGEGEESGEDGEPSDDPQDSDSDESQESEAKRNPANQIIDGETYYREILEEFKENLKKYLEEHRGELSDEEIAIIESYIGIV